MACIRILYVIGGLGRGGAEKQLYLLLKYMDRELFAPTVVSLSAGGDWADPIRQLGVTVIELPRRQSIEMRRVFALYRVIRQESPSILQTFLFSDNAYGLLAGCLARVPILIASRRIDRYGDSRRALHIVSRFLGQWADMTICNARRSIRYIPQSAVARHVVIPNGIEPLSPGPPGVALRKSLGLPVEGRVVGNIGRMVAGKNHRLFVEVAAEVLRVRSDTAFLLVGGGPLEQAIADLVRERGLKEKVILTGERGDALDLLGTMDLFLLTSDREGMSNATMEAMAAGLPCVVTDAGGNDELVIHGETGYLCPRENTPSLIQSLHRLLDDPDLRRRFGANGRKRMDTEFSAERMARATQSLYTNLLVSRRRRLSSVVCGGLTEPAGKART